MSKDTQRIVVVNKSNLVKEKDNDKIYISAKDKKIDQLTDKISDMFESGLITKQDNVLVNARQIQLLHQASVYLKQAVDAMDLGMPTDLIVTDLYDCWENLKEILGERAKEDLLDELFKRFCIGK